MKFRRRSAAADEADEATLADETTEQDDEESGEEAAGGPFDVDDLPEDDVTRVDLGSLLIEPEQGRELRLQVDEASGAVQSVLLAGQDGAIELRAFAAPRHGDLWSEVRPQIAADMAQKGGTATEREGPFGPELVCQMQVKRKEGGTATQPSRIIGINGPRWLLRATFFGKPALEPDAAGAWEDTVTRVAVRRGDHAMRVGEPLPVTLPDEARRVSPPTP
ncbi:MAG TPA: DUF3710 domain-containing protein [Nocardioides sp.]|nr:DUF3710 domain-containing protein [Nocardioides sp.]